MLRGDDGGEDARGNRGDRAERGNLLVGVFFVGLAEKVEYDRVHAARTHFLARGVVKNAVTVVRELDRVGLRSRETDTHEENCHWSGELLVETLVVAVVHCHRIHLVDQNVVRHVHCVQTRLEIFYLRGRVVAGDLAHRRGENLPISPHTPCRCCGPS